MKRRKFVVLVSMFTLLAIVVVALATVGVTVGTDPGREQVRAFIHRQLAGKVNGTIHIGRVTGGMLRGFTLDSFAIRGPDDSILVSTGRVTLQYDPRDLLDRRILLRNVTVEHPVIRLRQHRERDWNFQRILKKDDGPGAPNVPGRDFGDFVILDSVRVVNGTFILTRPWEPDDSLTGARRDSAIRVNLENPNREIRRSAEGLSHTYRWSRASAFLPHVRIAHPDSARLGQEFVIGDMRVEEQEPPFSFRNGQGRVRKQGDSVFIDVAHFDLPASTGSAKGKIWWGSNLPTRVDVRIDGDSVSLRDVAWVYETLPREGGGRTKVRIRNNPDNLDDWRYELTEMEMRSTKSRLTGAMTFVVGGPVLEVRDVDLRAAPVNFDLLRTLSGGPFPVDWQGDLIGHVRGPGGPVTDFVVSESDVTWRDTHVRGAVSRFSGAGTLDILQPEFTKFKGFDVNVARLDLLSIQYLFPEFLELGGTVAGTVTLDSSWLDVRFSEANVTHTNGPGDPSRITGNGRVTWGDEFMMYDLDVNAEPLSLTMLSRAYPLHMKGLVRGPVRARGTTDSMMVTLDLVGPAGRVFYDGWVDAYPLRVAARGSGRVETLNFAELFDVPRTVEGWVTGNYVVDASVDTNDIATLAGSASVGLQRGELSGSRVFPSRAVARFADRRLLLDTLRLESAAASITANGALGLATGVRDSVHYHVAVDSMGGLRPYITRLTAAYRPAGAPPDSLAGTLTVLGAASGSIQSLDVAGQLVGANVFVRREAGREITGAFAVRDVFRAPTGTGSLRFVDLNLGGVALDTLGGSLQLDEGRAGVLQLGALGRNGATVALRGNVTLRDSARADVQVSALNLATDSSRWSLRSPANVAIRGRGFAIDSLVLGRSRGGGRIHLAGTVPDTGRARILFRADDIPLYDVGFISQVRAPMAGTATVTLQGAGTHESPVMNAQLQLDGVRYGGLRVERVRGGVEYRNSRAEVSLDLARGGRDALFARGSLPIELRYFGARLLEDSLHGTIRTDNASFDIVEAVVPGLRDAAGSLAATIDVGGTWRHPDVAGALRVQDGEVTVDPLGIRVRGVQVDLGLFGHRDSLAIRRMVGWSGTSAADSVSIRGHVVYRELDNPEFNVRMDARTFHALDRRSLARLDVSTEPSGVRLRGPMRGATLTGELIVDRGVVFLPDPELARKKSVDLSSAFADTIARAGDAIPQPSSRITQSLLLDDVRVTLGDEVWLRSAEANIKLGGSLLVQRARERRMGALSLDEADSVKYVLTLDGQLRAERGTYTLSLGPVLKREFQVEGGIITFFPVAGLQPELNISALHTVRTHTGSGNQEMRIRVRLTGPLYPNPIVSLESAESFVLSQSNLVSYLIFGQPNFELQDAGQDYMKLAAQTLFPSAQSWATNSLRGWLGSAADIVQLNPGTADASLLTGEAGTTKFSDVLWSSRLGVEKQLTQNLFASVSTGICQLSGDPGSTQSAWDGWRQSLSGKIEWRLSRDASIKAGKEPSGALVCRPGSAMGSVVERPSQWGLSLFKTWRF